MTRLKGSLVKAYNHTTIRQAAEHYNGLQHELAAPGYTEEEADEANEAMKHMRSAFPGVEEEAAEVTRPPSLSRRAQREGTHGERHRRASPERRRSTSKRSAPPPASPRRRTGARGGTARQTTGRAFQFASSAGSALAPGWGDLIGEFLLAGIGLSIAYVLLTHPKGPSSLALGASNVVRALVSPAVDPLNPKG